MYKRSDASKLIILYKSSLKSQMPGTSVFRLHPDSSGFQPVCRGILAHRQRSYYP